MPPMLLFGEQIEHRPKAILERLGPRKKEEKQAAAEA
jgi:hypothetical protein